MARAQSTLRPLLLSLLFVLTSTALATGQKSVHFQGRVAAVRDANSFDILGYHVTLSGDTAIYSQFGSKKKADELKREIAPGMTIEVNGTRDKKGLDVTATRIWLHDYLDREVSGVAVVESVDGATHGTYLRADGYRMHLDGATDLKFSEKIRSVADAHPGIWIRYKGRFTGRDEVNLTEVEFIDPKPLKIKRDPGILTQPSTFAPGGIVDENGGYKTDSGKFENDGRGVPCGWFPVPPDAALQQRIRAIGEKLIPRFQRDLPDDDLTKIPFRFYVVDDNFVRASAGCRIGLILIPQQVVARLQNDDQIAAVIADGIAGNLQHVEGRIYFQLGLINGLTLSLIDQGPFWLSTGALVGQELMVRKILRPLEEQRGRVALSLMAQAGYDPWQAPEAWRLLAPAGPPKNPSKLKYPDRSKFQLEFLGNAYPLPAKGSLADASVPTEEN